VFLKHGRRRRGRAREKPLFLEERNSKHNQKTSKTETSVLSGPSGHDDRSDATNSKIVKPITLFLRLQSPQIHLPHPCFP
jgi:hypothetical protein